MARRLFFFSLYQSGKTENFFLDARASGRLLQLILPLSKRSQ